MQACNNTQMQHVKHATICKDGLKPKWEDLSQSQNSGQSAMEMMGKCAHKQAYQWAYHLSMGGATFKDT